MKKLVFLFSLFIAFSFTGIAQTHYFISNDGKMVVKAKDTAEYTFKEFVFNDLLSKNQNLEVIKNNGKPIQYNWMIKTYRGFHRVYKPNMTAKFNPKTMMVDVTKTGQPKTMFAWEIIVLFLLTFLAAFMYATGYEKKQIFWIKFILMLLVAIVLWASDWTGRVIIAENMMMVFIVTLISTVISFVIAFGESESPFMDDMSYFLLTSVVHIVIIIFISFCHEGKAWILPFLAYPFVTLFWLTLEYEIPYKTKKLWKKLFSKEKIEENIAE